MQQMVGTKPRPFYVILCPRYKSEVRRNINIYNISDYHYLHLICLACFARSPNNDAMKDNPSSCDRTKVSMLVRTYQTLPETANEPQYAISKLASFIGSVIQQTVLVVINIHFLF